MIVRATMLDDHAWYVPFAEFYTSEKLAWAKMPAKHSYERFPALEEFDTLIAAYAKEGVRPG